LTCKDLNTRYFHLSTLIKNRSNDINFLKIDSKVWVSSRADVGSNLSDHFTNLFSTSNPTIETDMLDLFSQVIIEEDNTALCTIPIELKIFQTLTSIGSSKALGPDGYTAFFFKYYWDTVKVDVMNFVWNFFRNNLLPRELNHTFLALIPKTSGSHSAHQFRPISLCNIAYKIIFKILANRLKPLLHKIISPNQSTFIPNRSIQDNSILAHELHSFKNKKGKGGFLFLNLDMEKAFDRMEWSFLIAIMEKIGFNPTWISWIRACITSLTFSILLNGSPYGFISPQKELRQGDPLSFFFSSFLALKFFPDLCLKKREIGYIKGLSIFRNNPAIHHLLFADDLLIFGRANLAEASCIKSYLEKYCKWFGQSINTSKSSIRFSKNTKPFNTSSISAILRFFSNPPKSLYLGLPILMGASKSGAF
jgi:hypothetical protein